MATRVLTEEGRERLMGELEELKTVRRPDIIRRIHDAKESGELSEGNESDQVKNDQAFIEGRILMLERLLKDAVVVSEHSSDTVSIGSTVEVKTASSGDRTFMIVGTDEIDLATGKISNESPVGQALLDRKVGDVVEVSTPAGIAELKITKVS